MAETGNLSTVCPPLVVHFLQFKYNHHYDSVLLSVVVLNSLIAFTTVCSNVLVALTISTTSSLHSPSYFLILGLSISLYTWVIHLFIYLGYPSLYILGLSISDFFVGVFVQTTFCVYKFFELSRSVAQFCSSGLVYISSSSVIGVASFLFLTALTADRFLAVHLHLRYKEIVTSQRYGVVITIIWLCSLIVGISRVLALNQASLVVMVILFVGLLALNIYFHVKILSVIRRHSKQIQSQNNATQQSMDMPKFKKSVNATYYVIAAFVICYVPQFCALAAHESLSKDRSALRSRYISLFTETLWMFNGVLNPIIYCWRMKAIRRGIRQVLRKIGCKMLSV